MSDPVFIGIYRADPESECTVYRAVESADDWDAPYCAIQDMLDILEGEINAALVGMSVTSTLRCAAILQKNNAFSTTRDRIANLIRVDPRNPNSPFHHIRSESKERPVS